ncbi:Bug family tripartite tricarboxylate transporter substrate binding protein [Alcaligenes faecalis]|uniref:Bug family tripartite tricarboxylate transporter substrate binding protein n=1 Tax=Alcaligenes faecalis TaxID=511 RepID=UPI0029331A78|nr:tripartite tricarboxylate transporter substrate binding protein [Alcaligenes faecalis]MDV2116996.1 tripartite tricarboxylate transporter substrate binding protein [Alcaligenes faecalis]
MNRRMILKASGAGIATRLGTAVSALGVVVPARAEQTTPFPSSPVRLVVPVSPGGNADRIARMLAQRLAELWRQIVIVDNVPGAHTSLGVNRVVRAAPTGYTLLSSGDQLAINAALGRTLPYSETDVRGVTRTIVNSQVLVVRPGLGISHFKDYVALLKRQPGAVSLALAIGYGSIYHLAVEMLNQRLGTQTNNIPYAGGAPAVLDILGGHVDGALMDISGATQNIQAGELVPLAVTLPQRSKVLPDVPTFHELGVSDFVIESWQGIFVPRATPDEVVVSLNHDITAVLRSREFAAPLEEQGFVIAPSSAESLDQIVARDIALFRDVAAVAGIKPE